MTARTGGGAGAGEAPGAADAADAAGAAGISGRTRLACILGQPVAHSLSPRLHNAAFAAAGVDAVYVALAVAPGELAAAVAGLRAVGILGANVTVPHKVAVAGLVDRCTDQARLVGAVNTLAWAPDGALVGDNTDAPALEAMLRDLAVGPGDDCLVLGAGGAARAAAVALGRLGARVTIAARDPQAAAAVAAVAAAAGSPNPGCVGITPESGVEATHPGVVVNATPLGLAGETLPVTVGPGQTAIDLIYHDTPFITAARAAGARAHNGLDMLIGQAAASFQIWTGIPAPREVMRRAAAAQSTPPS